MEGFQPRSCFAEEHETTNHVSKKLNKKRISNENHTQNEATGMPERYPCRFGDKSTGMANKSSDVILENEYMRQRGREIGTWNLAISAPNFFLSKRMPANKNDESFAIGDWN